MKPASESVMGLVELDGSEEKTLLLLRVDRQLPWEELARVLADDDLEGDALKREAARLRPRFQLNKDKLWALATREGLFPGSRDP